MRIAAVAALRARVLLPHATRGGLRMSPELLAKFRDADPDVLTAVHKENAPRVEKAVRNGYPGSSTGARVPGLGRAADHVDIVQEVFMRAFDKDALLAVLGSRPRTPIRSSMMRKADVDLSSEHPSPGRGDLAGTC